MVPPKKMFHESNFEWYSTSTNFIASQPFGFTKPLSNRCILSDTFKDLIKLLDLLRGEQSLGAS